MESGVCKICKQALGQQTSSHKRLASSLSLRNETLDRKLDRPAFQKAPRRLLWRYYRPPFREAPPRYVRDAAPSADWDASDETPKGDDERLLPQERGSNQISETAGSPSTSSKLVDKGNFIPVPWRSKVIMQVMTMWLLAYVIHPQWIMALGLELIVGIEREQLSARGEALYHIALDLGMLGFTVGILWLCLRRYKPLALGWFQSRVWPPRWGPCAKVLLACLMAFPFAMLLGDVTQMWVPISEAEAWNYHHLEQTLSAGDMITNGLYFLVLTICAPIWEELIFRGFLMPSLTRFMPLWIAVTVSSLIFACVHFSLQRFMVLVLLGIVFGALYAESHNLVAAITAHSLWNMWVFIQFLRDASPGLPV